ncbi:MAG: hypothetical protein ABIJ61_12665 [bacterium]
MMLRRPTEFELTVRLYADWQALLCALSLAAQKPQMTALLPVQQTPLLAPVERFLRSGGVGLELEGTTLALEVGASQPFILEEPLTDYDAVGFMTALAATRKGSKLSIGVEIDNTLEMLILALRRMGAQLDFLPASPAIMIVEEPVQRAIKYQLRRESAKITPHLLVAMAALPGKSEISDLFALGRFDDIFKVFVPGFERISLVESEPDDELERRLRRQKQVAVDYPSRIEITGGLVTDAIQLDLQPDMELAAYLSAGVAAGRQGRLRLQGLREEQIAETPLAQLHRMGVGFVAAAEGALQCQPTELKARRVTYEQMHAYPDAIGALALASARLDSTTVIRTARFATPREEARRHRLSELVKSLGVKIAEIKDGLVLEGRSDLMGDSISSDNDPVGQLMALAACLGPVRQIELDSVQAALDRWGASLQPVIDLLTSE